ncbi:MAG: malto-oligosyltrehalose trehalohydrolase [Pedobacter sp.]|nr:MAG: malto-oligosyltrehalose trehalohydrolase [Pedobacter sp.]
MNNMHISERKIGVNFGHDGKAVIKLWAPDAKQVLIKKVDGAGISLKRANYGYWETETELIIPDDLYWVILKDQDDEEHLLPDVASLSQPQGVHGPSQAMNLHHDWHDTKWVNPPLNEYIIYELHIGTFSATANFEGVVDRLRYLKELGITAIEIMPVAAFPGNRNWGYDGVFPFAVHSSYGGLQGLRRLVEVCHEHGIAVILDVVYNHLGPEGNYFSQFGPYFTDKYNTPWGNAINFDDRGSDAVRNFFIENAIMWFRDFHIDALRLDAMHAIKDFSATHILQEISIKTALLTAQTGRLHYLIAETDLNDPKYIKPISEHGIGMDAQWIDEFHHALRVSAGEPRKGYYGDFNGIGHLAKSYSDAYVFTGMYSEERMRTFGKQADGHPGKQFVVFSQNHDQVGNRMLGERTSMLVSSEMQKLLAAAVITAPFIPLLFMGEEWGETNPFLYFVSHTDPNLIDLVRKGRKKEFEAMFSASEAPDPQSEATFNRSKLNWDLLKDLKHSHLYDYYKALIAMRKTNLQLRMCDREATIPHVFEQERCLIIERGLTGSDELVLCILNFSDQLQQIELPKGIEVQELLINSSTFPEKSAFNELITIQPESFIAYSATYV